MPIYALTSLVAVAALFAYGPEEMGGNGDLARKIEPFKDLERAKWEEAVNKVRFRLDLCCLRPIYPLFSFHRQMYKRVKSEIVDLPGLPPMHDYEHYPQKVRYHNEIISDDLLRITILKMIFGDNGGDFVQISIYCNRFVGRGAESTGQNSDYVAYA